MDESIDLNSKHRLELLARQATPSNQHPWKEYADLIQEWGGIVSASRTGFKVAQLDGCRIVGFRGGLKEEHYSYFAPMLEAFDQAQLALAVIQNRVNFSYCDWHAARTLLCQQYGRDEERWLPEKIDAEGFDCVAAELTRFLLQYRRLHPTPRLSVTVCQRPVFDSTAGLLSLGEHEWRFRKQDGPVWKLLCELERLSFQRSVWLKELTPDQVRDARKLLHKKTAPIIQWSAHADGYLSWCLGTTAK